MSQIYYIIGGNVLKKMLLFCLSWLLLSVPTVQATDAEFMFDRHHQLLTLVQMSILDDDDLTPSEIYDYISVIVKLSDAGIEDLEKSEENTILNELKLKQYSLELFKLLLAKEASK